MWRDWCLTFRGEKLTDGRAALRALGIASDGARLTLHSLRADRVASARARKRAKARRR